MKKQPKQKRSQQVVDAVLEATTRILTKIRLRDATTNNIAETAGVSIGSLYDYFPNKKAIAVSLMDKRIDSVVSEFEKLLERSNKPLEEVVDDSVEFITKDFFERRSLLREIFLLAPEAGRMDMLYKSRIRAVEVFKNFLIKKFQKNPDWAEWKSFFLIHSVLGFLESYIIIEDANFEVEHMKVELKTHIASILEIKS